MYCVGAYVTEDRKAMSEIQRWHSEEMFDSHHRDVDYARRAADTANTPAS